MSVAVTDIHLESANAPGTIATPTYIAALLFLVLMCLTYYSPTLLMVTCNLVIAVYDWLLCLGQEVRFVRTQRPGPGVTLWWLVYALSRYSQLIYAVLTVTMINPVSDSVRNLTSTLHSFREAHGCICRGTSNSHQPGGYQMYAHAPPFTTAVG